MDPPTFTESFIRTHASPQSFQRGQVYYDAGSVLSLVRRGDELLAEVEGSQYPPYQVRVIFDDGAAQSAVCDCPYDWGGWCKHVVAVLLAALHEPGQVEERPTLEGLLDDLDRAQLQALVQHLAARRPDLVAEVESWLALNRAPSDTDAAASTPRVDPEPIRRRVHAALHALDRMRPSEAYWHVDSVVDEVRQVLADVQGYLNQGAGKEALVVLEALTDAYVKEWMWLDDSDGFAHEFIYELGPVWTEALLSADLMPADREHWVEQLDAWQDELNEYGLEDAFWTARNAAEQDWEDLDDVGDDEELVNARLNVLARRGEHEAFLQLAGAAGQYGRYAVMLAQVGRIQEAAEAGRRDLSTAAEAFTLARVLLEHGAAQPALDVAEHGLSLDGRYEKAELAVWLRDQAERIGQTDLALRAALVAVQVLPDINAYVRAEGLADSHWPEHKADLLERLRQKSGYADPQGLVDIFLHEGLIDDAIAFVQKGYAGYGVQRQVADAAVEARPEWVIATARTHAEEIMEGGRSQHYHHAADWLAKARDAFRAAERDADWQAYLAALLERHRRKYKLMPLLQQLQG